MKRTISIFAVVSVLGSFAAIPLHAQAAAQKVVVKDPAGDANGVNDQGTSDGSFGDQTAAAASTVTDIESVSLSNDSKNLYVTFLTQNAPPATEGVGYRVRFNPTAAPGTQCILIEAFFPGGGNDLSEAQAQVRNTCSAAEKVTAVKISATTVIIPRKVDKAFGPGAKLTKPQAQGFVYTGSSYPAGVMYPVLDTTKVGTDYTFTK